MQKVTIGVFVALWTAQVACADGNLKLVGEDVAWQEGAQLRQYAVQVVSTSTPVVLTAWQFRCQIMPQPGAVGDISFASPPFSAASPFFFFDVLAGSPGDGSSSATPGIRVSETAIGFAYDVSGVEIPNTNTDLLWLELTVGANALGKFDIAVVPGSELGDYTGAEWCSNDDVYPRRPFEGVLFSGGPVTIDREVQRSA